MIIAYASRTGQVKKFISKLGMHSVEVTESLVLDTPFILITYTTGFGQIPEDVENFLAANHQHLKGVSASGNRMWGDNFAKSADAISQKYGVPVVSKFEMAGTLRDITNFKEGMKNIETH